MVGSAIANEPFVSLATLTKPRDRGEEITISNQVILYQHCSHRSNTFVTHLIYVTCIW